MSELKECPFCNEENTVVRLKRDGKPTGMIGHACRVLNLEIRASETAWNTRAERTCENTSMKRVQAVEGVAMRYRCIKELRFEATTIPAETVIEHVGHDSIHGRAFVTFRLGLEHYAVESDAFREHFEEVEI